MIEIASKERKKKKKNSSHWVVSLFSQKQWKPGGKKRKDGIFKTLKDYNSQVRILCLVKITLKNEDENLKFQTATCWGHLSPADLQEMHRKVEYSRGKEK